MGADGLGLRYRMLETVRAYGLDRLAWLDGEPSVWWHGLCAVLQARLALAVLADGDEDRCRALLADALRTASD